MRACSVACSLVGTVAMVGCARESGDARASDPSGEPAPTGTPEPRFDNAIDLAVWPRFVKAGHTKLQYASETELCRRIALDFAGVSPSPDEVRTHCVGKSASQMLDAFMELPAYEEREQRLWIQHVGADPERLIADDIVDADRIFLALARGAIGYDDFAAQILAHPVGAVNRRLGDPEAHPEAHPEAQFVEDEALFAFRVFLGRTPVGAEASDFSNLFRVWKRDYGPGNAYGYANKVQQARLDPAGCYPFACTSTLLGTTTTIDLAFPAGTRCQRLDAKGAPYTLPGLCFQDARGGKLPAAVQAELEKPGRLLAQRPEFWGEAADHALSRLLGWWKSTADEPDSVLPEVRTAAATYFRALPRRDIRELYKLIATSLLYRTTFAPAAETKDDEPPWFSGPLKMMDAEQFLRSAGRALGIALGFCDPHTTEPLPGVFFPTRLRKPQPGDFYGFGHDFYLTSARAMGGCSGGTPGPKQIEMEALAKQVEVASVLCEKALLAPPVIDLADGSQANIETLVDFQFRALLARPAGDDEKQSIAMTAASCLPNASCTMTTFIQELCGSQLRSTAYLYY